VDASNAKHIYVHIKSSPAVEQINLLSDENHINTLTPRPSSLLVSGRGRKPETMARMSWRKRLI
jgi:hypothetical protein